VDRKGRKAKEKTGIETDPVDGIILWRWSPLHLSRQAVLSARGAS
jgi:hypothetical protein